MDSNEADSNNTISLTEVGLEQTDEVSNNGPEEPNVEIETSKIYLKREIGLLGGVSFVVGSIIGSGIFITPQAVIMNTGSVGLYMMVWSSGAILAMLGSLTFIELMSICRKSGGEYAVLHRTLGRVPAFMFVWSLVNPATVAVQLLTFAEYLSTLLESCGSPVLPKKLVALALLIFLAITNSHSVRVTHHIQVIFTAVKFLGIFVIMIGGLIKIGQGTVSELPSGFEGSVTSPVRISLAYYSVMFAYNGWNCVNFLIEEVERPRRNGPRSSVIGVVVAGVVYILTNISYLALMSRQELLQSTTVAHTWGVKVLGPASWIIPVLVMMSAFGSANGGIATGTRIQFAAARDEIWWGVMSFVNVKRYTPTPAIIMHAFIVCIMLIVGSINSLISFLTFSSWIVYGQCAICCIILRFKAKDDVRRIKIPIIIPIIFLLCCLFLNIAPLVQSPRLEMVYGVAYMVSGIIIYFSLIYLDLKPKFINKLEMYLQLLLEVAPAGYNLEDN